MIKKSKVLSLVLILILSSQSTSAFALNNNNINKNYSQTVYSLDGWVFENNSWVYYINNEVSTGWHYINDYWYYFNSDGVMLKNITQLIDGQQYRFNSNGEILSDVWDEATYINSNGIVLTPSKSMTNSYTQYKLFNYMTNEKIEKMFILLL